MNVLDNGEKCRLCYIKLENDKSVHIFEKEANLAQKINDTLPLKVLPNDNNSKYICLDCYMKVIKHYDFMQNILELSKENVNTTENNLCELSRNEKIEIISKLHDMVYTCPNCNIDLMIIISSNFEDSNYPFQITLAAIDQMEKSVKEEEIQTLENTMDFNNICTQKLNIIDNEMESSCITISENNEVCESSPVLQEDANYIDAYIAFPNENVLHQTSANAKKRFQEDVIFEIDNDPTKLLKIEMEVDTTQDKTDTNSLNTDYDGVSDLLKIDRVNDNISDLINVETVNNATNDLVKTVPVNGGEEWLNMEADGKEDGSTAYTTETEKERVDEDSAKCGEDIDVKSGPRIMCNLCGIRFISQMKYEFHMERHELNKMDKFICTICDKEASNENLLWNHYFHTHKNSVRHACTGCGKMFVRKTRLKSHQDKYKHFGTKELRFDVDMDETSLDQENATLRKQNPVNCSLCRKPITDLDPKAINDLVTCAACEDSTLSLMVDGVEMKVISPRQYHCSKCSKHFVRKERLEFHEMRHNENMNEFICSTCGKEFSAENSLYEHYLFVHKGARPHICELCGKSFQLKTRLKEHHRTHTGERPYQCDVCGQRCMTTNALKLHRKIHFSHKRYNCNICEKSFTKKQNMNEHLEKHWKNDKNVSLPHLFTCPVCGEDLPTYRMLKCHMTETHQIHHQDPLLTGQKPWHECDECHEKFKHQMSLKAHKERVHEGRVSPIFECDTCKATYKIKQMLINHIRSKHQGEKRYKCAQCRKGFNDTKSLYNHILLHTGRKPFQCEYCNISFRRKDSRDHHRRKHTGEQPYQCSDCGQTFSTYNNRSKHRKKEHGEGEVECQECGKKCSSQQEIRIHWNKHLGEKLNKLMRVTSCTGQRGTRGHVIAKSLSRAQRIGIAQYDSILCFSTIKWFLKVTQIKDFTLFFMGQK
ncbi:LOW QUALITY PROTEIN: zinc finger protein 420-like [Harpegnathos saltator]|uniref:LOW QUALITY PROTEIN: zinc finger protein 420-like n=1 Tax=Harpegnathos saltator TaxID=610380 RepID=UPI000DBEE88E|nr:LOW QUALITY PROTEIN: zinc finger protein 420-like [Harpegnathos saltator]